MKLLIETSLENLLIALATKENALKDKTLFVEKRKADALPIEVEKLLEKNDLSIKDIDSIYITLGPGSFMGARTALVYARTIAQVSNIKLYTASSFAMFKGLAFIDAKGNKAYKSDMTVVEAPEEFTKVDYEWVLNNLEQVFKGFKLETDLTSIKPMYLKEPQIGGK